MVTPSIENPSPTSAAIRRLRVHYLLIGLVYGAVWAINGNEPAWEHALVVLGLVLIGLPLSHVARSRLAVFTTSHRPARRPL